jgi:hypothetical protein
MSIQFKFEQIESTASNLYKTEVTDNNGNILFACQIACDNQSQLESVALEAYDLYLNPPKPKGAQND